MTTRPLLTIVLAAGKGTRMKSARPKVLHAIAGRSMLGHVLVTAPAGRGDRIAVVTAPGMDDVVAEVRRWAPSAETFVQAEQLGTAHAVLAARAALDRHDGDVLVVFGDTPLLQPETLERLRATLDGGAAIAVLGFEAVDPAGYGRLICNAAGGLEAIREDKELADDQRAIRLCNGGVMAFRLPRLAEFLESIGKSNAKAEYYLTDAVGLARSAGHTVGVVVCPESEVLGINSRDQLAAAEAIWQARRRRDVMLAGATLIAPETVWLAYDTTIGRDVVIEPNVYFGPRVRVEDGVHIRANTHIDGGDDGVHIRSGAIVGPFARLRPGADIGADVHIGNFVEVKNARLEEGAKANHLSYIGDGRVGAGANIGAGTIFCNYDGFFKHHTDVGKGAFIGSNSSLVAPVKIGDGAFVGSGSVITKDVAADALAVERSSQEERPGWAAKFRAMMSRRKAGRENSGQN